MGTINDGRAASAPATTMEDSAKGHEQAVVVGAVEQENLRLVGLCRQQQQQQQRCCRTNSHCVSHLRRKKYYRGASLPLLVLHLVALFVMGNEVAAVGAASTTSSVLLQSDTNSIAKNSPEIHVFAVDTAANYLDASEGGEDDENLIHPLEAEISGHLRRHLRGNHQFKFRLLDEDLDIDHDDDESTTKNDDQEMNVNNEKDNDDNNDDDDENGNNDDDEEEEEGDDNDSAGNNGDESEEDTSNDDDAKTTVDNDDKAGVGGNADIETNNNEGVDTTTPSIAQSSLPSTPPEIERVGDEEIMLPMDESEVMGTSAATGGGSDAATATISASAARENDDTATTTTAQTLNDTKKVTTHVNEDDDVVEDEEAVVDLSKEELPIKTIEEAEISPNVENGGGNNSDNKSNFETDNDDDDDDDKNDEYIVLDPGDEGGITALEGEIENIEEEIEAVEAEDDDGEYAQTKEEYIEDLKDLDQQDTNALEDALLNKTILVAKNTSGSSISSNVSDVVIDPSLTMDWTTLNPPDTKGGDMSSALDTLLVSEEKSGINGSATENATEPVIVYNDDDDDNTASTNEEGDGVDVERPSTEDNDAAGTTKEAVSPPSNMETEPERTHVNSTTTTSVVVVDEDEGIESEAANNSELDSVIAASQVESQGDETLPGPVNATNATTIASSVEIGDALPKTIAPTDDAPEATTPPPSPTPSFFSMITTSSPTPIPTEEEYEESTDDSPLPATYEPPAKSDDDETSKNDDSINEEEFPPTTTTDEANDWDTNVKDELYKEEQEEVKKVGGWLSFVSVVLLVYTAYQMSENPDGICASMCRLVITVLGCIVKIMLIPFKYVVGGGRPSGGHYMATPDYRDPYGSRHMELT